MQTPPPIRRFDRRVALVTGAGSGIGRAAAVRLAEEGAAVAATDRDEDGLRATIREVEERGGQGIAIVGDVTSEADLARCVERTVAELGRLDTLVANAGIIRRDRLAHEVPLEQWDELLATNLSGVFLAVRTVLPEMLKLDGDRSIVTVGSTLDRSGAHGVSPYAASKGGIVALTKALAFEYAEHGIRVNCVLPAITVTAQSYTERPDFDRQRDHLASLYPLRRLGRPEDIAAAIAFVASTDASWVTGLELVVDGGRSIA